MSSAATASATPAAAMLAAFKRQLENMPFSGKMTPEAAEAVYAMAYREYTRARYEEAVKLFQLLLVYRPTNPAYLLGAGLCLQRLRRFDLAIAAYTALGFLDPEQPSHRLAVAECQLLKREHDAARSTLTEVIGYCRKHTSHDQILSRAQAMLELMRPQNVAAAA